MPVSVSGEAPRGLAAPVGAVIRATLAGEGLRIGEIGVILARDPELRDLNRRWRGIDRATDVLSFPYGEVTERGGRRPPGGRVRRDPTISGDLVISIERVFAQARRYRVTPGRELRRLVVHGALHLAGHDHHRAGERRLMRARETAALRRSGAAERAMDRALGRGSSRSAS